MPESELVSVPYEITLLSNTYDVDKVIKSVSVPYEITLLSNRISKFRKLTTVSVPYEITLLSNFKACGMPESEFQYLMKLHYSQTTSNYPAFDVGFSTL